MPLSVTVLISSQRWSLSGLSEGAYQDSAKELIKTERRSSVMELRTQRRSSGLSEGAQDSAKELIRTQRRSLSGLREGAQWLSLSGRSEGAYQDSANELIGTQRRSSVMELNRIQRRSSVMELIRTQRRSLSGLSEGAQWWNKQWLQIKKIHTKTMIGWWTHIRAND